MNLAKHLQAAGHLQRAKRNVLQVQGFGARAPCIGNVRLRMPPMHMRSRPSAQAVERSRVLERPANERVPLQLATTVNEVWSMATGVLVPARGLLSTRASLGGSTGL